MTTALIAEIGFGHTDLRGDDPGTEIAYGRSCQGGDHVDIYRDLSMVVIYIYICIFKYIYMHTGKYTYIYMCAHRYIWIYGYVDVCEYVNMHTCIYI